MAFSNLFLQKCHWNKFLCTHCTWWFCHLLPLPSCSTLPSVMADTQSTVWLATNANDEHKARSLFLWTVHSDGDTCRLNGSDKHTYMVVRAHTHTRHRHQHIHNTDSQHCAEERYYLVVLHCLHQQHREAYYSQMPFRCETVAGCSTQAVQ